MPASVMPWLSMGAEVFEGVGGGGSAKAVSWGEGRGAHAKITSQRKNTTLARNRARSVPAARCVLTGGALLLFRAKTSSKRTVFLPRLVVLVLQTATGFSRANPPTRHTKQPSVCVRASCTRALARFACCLRPRFYPPTSPPSPCADHECLGVKQCAARS